MTKATLELTVLLTDSERTLLEGSDQCSVELEATVAEAGMGAGQG